MRQIGFFLLLITLSACGSRDALPGYYDVGEMIFDLSLSLGAEERAVEKFAILDGDSTSLDLDFYRSSWIDQAVDLLWGINMAQSKWYSELNVMKEINPNQPKYLNKFEITEGESEAGNSTVIYKARSPKTDLQEFYVEESEGELVYLSAKLQHNNILASNYREYRLRPDGTLEIEGSQDIILLPEKTFAIRVEF